MTWTVEHLERLYAEGYSCREIGAAIYQSRTFVTERLHDAGVRLRPSGGSPKRSNADYDPLIRELYVDYAYSTREIGEELAWSKTFVRRRLIEMGVPLRPRGGNQRRVVFEGFRAKRLYEQEKLTLDEVAEAVGVSRPTVIKWLDRMGVKRPRGAAAVQRARSRGSSPDLRGGADAAVAGLADPALVGAGRREVGGSADRRGRGARVLAGVAAVEGDGRG